MLCFRDDLLHFYHISTFAAMTAFRFSFFCTACRLCCVYDFCMRHCFYDFSLFISTCRTGQSFDSFFCTRRWFCYLFLICMFFFRYNLLHLYYKSTFAAMTAFRFSILCTACRLCCVYDFCMRCFFYDFCIAVSTPFTGICPNPFLTACCFLCHLTRIIMLMNRGRFTFGRIIKYNAETSFCRIFQRLYICNCHQSIYIIGKQHKCIISRLCILCCIKIIIIWIIF